MAHPVVQGSLIVVLVTAQASVARIVKNLRPTGDILEEGVTFCNDPRGKQ